VNAHAAKSIILIAGPTASGKSALAVQVAQAVGGEIINADASQVYRDLLILSARPELREMADVPHHLFGHLDGAQACSTADWRDQALAVIAQIWARHAVPVVVGGTGLYLKTLLGGIADVPDVPPSVRAAVRGLTTEQVRAALLLEDPAMAVRLNPADRQRQARALEVMRASGTSLCHWQQQLSGGLTARSDVATVLKIVLLPDRAALYARCEGRFRQMMDRGALREVQALLARNLDASLPVMKALGVPELAAVLRQGTDMALAIAAAAQSTRHYAKRQYTWMRNQFPDWHRLETFGEQLVNDDLAILLREYGLTVK
jgi:tRNA dimethylallyltransferase